jgi:polysaccharide biosynthesis/export protein
VDRALVPRRHIKHDVKDGRMHCYQVRDFWALTSVLLCVCMASAGCHVCSTPPYPSVASPRWVPPEAPRELNKVILPLYTIEPPDILAIDAINVVPKSPYHLRTLDKLMVRVDNALPEAPISGVVVVETGGIVQLGMPYGSVKVAGMTTDEAKKAIEQHLSSLLKTPTVMVSLSEMAGKQLIAGEHLVCPDGTVTLGGYGSVSVVGKTLAEAKAAIEAHLSQYLEEPEVSVEVFAYNSKAYYVVTQGLGVGTGDRVARFPVTGNETVLDAISAVAGLSPTSSARVWIARPGQCGPGHDQILPVDWAGITECGDTTTNYQVLPGDRLYVAEDKMIAFDQGLGKLIAPMERVMGFTLLGVGTVSRVGARVITGTVSGQGQGQGL